MTKSDRSESWFSGNLASKQDKETVVNRKRFSVEQIVEILKQTEMAMPMTDVTR